MGKRDVSSTRRFVHVAFRWAAVRLKAAFVASSIFGSKAMGSFGVRLTRKKCVSAHQCHA